MQSKQEIKDEEFLLTNIGRKLTKCFQKHVVGGVLKSFRIELSKLGYCCKLKLVFVVAFLSKRHIACHWGSQFNRRVIGIVDKSFSYDYNPMGFSFTGAEEQNGPAVCVTISWTLFSGVLAPSYVTDPLL